MTTAQSDRDDSARPDGGGGFLTSQLEVPPLCSQAARDAADDPAGSAATFQSFLLLDHRERWTAEAADDAVRRLRPDTAAAVRGVAGLRSFAIRAVQPRSTVGFPAAIAGRAGPDGNLRRWSELPDGGPLRVLDRSADAGGSDGDGNQDGYDATADPGPLFAVCTNGRRDRCCAIAGRAVAVGLHATWGDRVVEISHLGGHRYAGTMLVLPWGYAYGFLDLAGATAVAQAAVDGLVHPEHLRGRADLSPVAQAAEVLLRRRLGPASPGAVRIVDATADRLDPDAHRVRAVVDGKELEATLRRHHGATVTDTLCGGKPFSTGRWELEAG